jgi:hypothetical protein
LFLIEKKMILNAKTAAEVGYLLVNMLRFWHSAIDCLVALVVEVEAVAKMLEVGLSKQQKLQGGYPHTLEYKASGTKQYA